MIQDSAWGRSVAYGITSSADSEVPADDGRRAQPQPMEREGEDAHGDARHEGEHVDGAHVADAVDEPEDQELAQPLVQRPGHSAPGEGERIGSWELAVRDELARRHVPVVVRVPRPLRQERGVQEDAEDDDEDGHRAGQRERSTRNGSGHRGRV